MANFIRKNTDPAGTYHLAYKVGPDENGVPKIVEAIRIEGKTIFSTDDKKLIEILRNDPEIIEINKKTQIEAQ
jgi:hypothetical protein